MERNVIRTKVINAVKSFNAEKQHLYSVGIYEPTLSHRIALHLEVEFAEDGYTVDCEYNKNLGAPKMNDDEIHIRPDIIVHRRGQTDHNLVILEVKKGSKDTKLAKADIKKLQKTENLNYSQRVFIGVLKDKTDIVWIDDLTTSSIEVEG